MIEFKKGLLPAIIVDIDGTIAYNNGHRGWYEYDKVKDDEVILPILDIIKRYKETHSIIFVSGRNEDCRDITQEWFTDNNIPWDYLYMRKSEDRREDAIVKKEIYEANIKDRFNVLFVLDDRLRVCRMWYNLGLTILRVGDPDADF